MISGGGMLAEGGLKRHLPVALLLFVKDSRSMLLRRFGEATVLVAALVGLGGCSSGNTAARVAPDPCHVFTSDSASSILGEPVTCSILVTGSGHHSFTAGYSTAQEAPSSSSDPYQVVIEGAASVAQGQLAGQPGATPVQVAGKTAYGMASAFGTWQLAALKNGLLVTVTVPTPADQAHAISAMSVILGHL